MLGIWEASARATGPRPYFYANHASATSLRGRGPKDWAQIIHQYGAYSDNVANSDGRKMLPALAVGPHAPQVILMDFPPVDIIEFIIARNFVDPCEH